MRVKKRAWLKLTQLSHEGKRSNKEGKLENQHCVSQNADIQGVTFGKVLVCLLQVPLPPNTVENHRIENKMKE